MYMKFFQKLKEKPTIYIITAVILALCIVLALLPGGRAEKTDVAQDEDFIAGNHDEHTILEADVGEIVIVLDPGHDSVHTGTISDDGVMEEDLTLKIANYCKDALEEYPGVEVYLTRTEAGCPFTGTYEPECLENRVEFAKDLDATLFVSLHLNWSSDPSVNGVQIYVPNENYNKRVFTEAGELADCIMSQLNDLGLEFQKIYSKDSTDRVYPDGTAGDYWSIVYNCKLNGFPGIIVEHAFISSPSDFENFLSTDEKLKSLGEADARGIAEYLGLEL